MLGRNYFRRGMIILLVLLATLTVYLNWFPSLRWLIVFSFLLICPGLSFIYIIPSNDFITKAFLMVVISLGINTLTSVTILYLGRWSPSLILLIMIAFSLIGLLLEVSMGEVSKLKQN